MSPTARAVECIEDHGERLRQLIRPEFNVDVYIADKSDPVLGPYRRTHDFRAAPALMRLELQYAVQRRHDDRGSQWRGEEVNAIARAVTGYADSDSFTTAEIPPVVKARVRLGTAWRYIAAIIHGVIDRTDDWDSDIWDLRRLGLVHHTRFLHFERIPQPWLRAMAKRSVRFEMSRGVSSSAVTWHFNGLADFAASLAVRHPSARGPEDVTRADLESFVIAVRHRGHPVGGRHNLYGLKTFLERAERLGWGSFQGRLYVSDIPQERKLEPRAIDEFVMAQLESPGALAQISNPQCRAAIELIMLHGMRVGECLRLSFDPVSYDSAGAPQLTVPITKTGIAQNVIPVSDRTVEIVTEQRERVRQRFGYDLEVLFPRGRSNPDGLRHMTYDTVKCSLDRWLKTLGVHDRSGRPVHITIHQFRHTLGTRMVNQGIPTGVIRRMLGHKTVEMTEHYARINDGTLRRAWESFSASRVNVRGELLQQACSDAEWTKERLGRALVATQNGYCGRPLQIECPHPNACLTCPDFLTDASYLGAHRRQLAETQRFVSAAEIAGNSRVLDMNRQVAASLETIIASLEPFEKRDGEG